MTRGTSIETRELLDEREKICGDYADHAHTLISVMEHLMIAPGWDKLSSCMKETIYMTIFKYARILNGDPNFLDHWQDVVGYNQLIVDRLHKPIPSRTAADDGWTGQ